MPKNTSSVDDLIRKAGRWQKEFQKLRSIVLSTGLTEEVKWGQPCYTDRNRNIVLIHGFKEYCALLFFKGALLKDREGILIQQTENVQAGRQIRFTGIREIAEVESVLKSYIFEAIEIERAGLKVQKKNTSEYSVPQELAERFRANPKLRRAFTALTPGRQNAYLFYFTSAKQSKTRESRIEKYVPSILAGKGMND